MCVNSANENVETSADSAEVKEAAPATAETESAADLAAQVAALTSEKAELYDRLLRRQAEFDNYRKRVERDKSELIASAGSELALQLLPVLDDLDRALASECGDADFAKGVELIYQRLMDTLKKAGLEPFSSEGQVFDPYVHHAMEMVETDEVEDHTVLAELMKGYNFRGKLLRPAMVRVAVAPSAGK